jgi:hypothetical protein
MKHLFPIKLLILLTVISCQSNTVYYRAIQNTTLSDLQGQYIGTIADLIFVTEMYFEISEKSAQARVFNDAKGASFRVWNETCKPEIKKYNFGPRVFLYQCPNIRIFRTDKGIFAQVERLGEISYEPKGISLIPLEKVPKTQYDASLKEREETVISTTEWYKKYDFIIEAWSFENKYAKYEMPIREKLAEIKRKHKYEEQKGILTTDQLLEIEHEIGLEIHSFVVRNYR